VLYSAAQYHKSEIGKEFTMTSKNIDELVILDKSVRPANVQREIDTIIAELKKRKVEEATRIEPKDYVASQGAHGVGVIETIVIAYLGGLATAAGATTWNKIIWPSLKARLGGKIKRKAE
jgi:hypothetical protein